MIRQTTLLFIGFFGLCANLRAQEYTAPPPTLDPIVVQASGGGIGIMQWDSSNPEWTPQRKIWGPGEQPDLTEGGGGASSDYWDYEYYCTSPGVSCNFVAIQARKDELTRLYSAGQSYWDQASKTQVQTAIKKLDEYLSFGPPKDPPPAQGW
ncbi:hypothetical protein [Lysobacter enzymogenes]|jgi:hypothetical protein|uniref:hypothetical protein n=1 Tax=Lysobacter enzymogenes TaxID=69 RepID=UPI001113CB44|nr:hypothetical protein [Lysobacter enzymogenes]